MKSKEVKYVVIKVIIMIITAIICFRSYKSMMMAKNGDTIAITDETITNQLIFEQYKPIIFAAFCFFLGVLCIILLINIYIKFKKIVGKPAENYRNLRVYICGIVLSILCVILFWCFSALEVRKVCIT